MLFSIACLLACADSLLHHKKTTFHSYFSIVILLTYCTYLVSDLIAIKSIKPPLAARGEMAVYSIAPGYERNLGPLALNGGIVFRKQLYGYLKENNLSVFSHPAYKSLGFSLMPTKQKNSVCKITKYVKRNRDNKFIVRAEASGISLTRSSMFLLADKNLNITNFSFAEKPDYFSKKIMMRFFTDSPSKDHSIIFIQDFVDAQSIFEICTLDAGTEV
jgi:hypothetical protein